MRVQSSFVVASMVLLAGCATSGPRFEVDGKAITAPDKSLQAMSERWRQHVAGRGMPHRLASDSGCAFDTLETKKGRFGVNRVICGPVRYADNPETRWDEHRVIRETQGPSKGWAILAPGATFTSVDVTRGFSVRRADGHDVDLSIELEEPEARELPHGQSVSFDEPQNLNTSVDFVTPSGRFMLAAKALRERVGSGADRVQPPPDSSLVDVSWMAGSAARPDAEPAIPHLKLRAGGTTFPLPVSGRDGRTVVSVPGDGSDAAILVESEGMTQELRLADQKRIPGRAAAYYVNDTSFTVDHPTGDAPQPRPKALVVSASATGTGTVTAYDKNVGGWAPEGKAIVKVVQTIRPHVSYDYLGSYDVTKVRFIGGSVGSAVTPIKVEVGEVGGTLATREASLTTYWQVPLAEVPALKQIKLTLGIEAQRPSNSYVVPADAPSSPSLRLDLDQPVIF